MQHVRSFFTFELLVSDYECTSGITYSLAMLVTRGITTDGLEVGLIFKFLQSDQDYKSQQLIMT